MKKNLETTYLFLVGMLLMASSAIAAVESVQLDYVALDTSVECNRILFQSSQHFKKTIFAIPRVVPGTGIETARTYNITPASQHGMYTLTINLYFPSNDEVLKSSAASTFKKDLYACNWDKVKNAINKNIQETDAKIQTISRIPLTSIEVRLPGIKDIGLIGKTVSTNEESDILDYYGKSLTATFTITESEKNIFQSRLVSLDGISAAIKFRFQARSRKGSVKAQIDLQNLAQNFSAAASAKGLKFLASADLTSTLKSSITKNSVQITSEAADNSDDVSKITSLLVEKILKELDLSLTTVKLNDADRAKTGSGQISVAAVIEVLKTKISSEISFNLIAAPESASAQTEIKLKTDRLNDPNVIEVAISAGYVDPSLGVSINAGQSITLTPAYWYLDKIEYNEVRTYLTTGEIQTLNLPSYFEDLVNQNMHIADIEINGTLLAEGKWTPLNGQSPISSPNKYRWARIQKIANRLRDSSNIIPTTIDAFNDLPIYLTFSELGDRRFVKLSELIQENPFWKAVYDQMTGRLILKAKQNLGTVRIRERMRGDESIKYASQPIILDQVYQQKTNMFGNSEYTSNYVLKKDTHSIVLQKSIVLFITRPKIMKDSEIKYLKPLPINMY